ncbi:MAG: hypothetical protein Q4G33_12755 [bacterium]|nr:hypothetical protein [bacterium]
MNLKSIAEEFTGRSINAVITEDERKSLCSEGFIMAFEYEGAFYTMGAETGGVTVTENSIRIDLNIGYIKAEIKLGVQRVDSAVVISGVGVEAGDGNRKVCGIVPFENFILYDGNAPYCTGIVFNVRNLNNELNHIFSRKAV